VESRSHTAYTICFIKLKILSLISCVFQTHTKKPVSECDRLTYLLQQRTYITVYIQVRSPTDLEENKIDLSFSFREANG